MDLDFFYRVDVNLSRIINVYKNIDLELKRFTLLHTLELKCKQMDDTTFTITIYPNSLLLSI